MSAADVHGVLVLFLMVVAILLAGDDDLPGPRRSFARIRREPAPIPF